MALPENRKAVSAILNVLESKILGQERPARSCCCGAIKSGAAKATTIVPAGDEYPGQETQSYLWRVKMTAYDGGNNWSTGISEFLSSEEINALFLQHFGKNPKSKNRYELPVHSETRIHKSLPPIVQIRENAEMISFRIDWGTAQATAKTIHELASKKPRLQWDDVEVAIIFGELLFFFPEVHVGGPEPELPFESKWRTDFADTLADASTHTGQIYFLNIGSLYTGGKGYFTNIEIVFRKS